MKVIPGGFFTYSPLQWHLSKAILFQPVYEIEVIYETEVLPIRHTCTKLWSPLSPLMIGQLDSVIQMPILHICKSANLIYSADDMLFTWLVTLKPVQTAIKFFSVPKSIQMNVYGSGLHYRITPVHPNILSSTRISFHCLSDLFCSKSSHSTFFIHNVLNIIFSQITKGP